MNISVNWSYFDLDWGKLDIVHPGFGFVDNYLSKMWRFNQLGKFFHWIWSIFEQKMDKFSQVRKFFTYIMVQESGLRLNIKLDFYCKSVFTVAEWIRGKQFQKVSSICTVQAFYRLVS